MYIAKDFGLDRVRVHLVKEVGAQRLLIKQHDSNIYTWLNYIITFITYKAIYIVKDFGIGGVRVNLVQ